jgi:hypothetical protein
MAKRPRPVRDLDDACTWLSFFARFSDGDLARNADGVLSVLLKIDCENEELRARCIALSRTLELIEARKGDGL